ncbi:MAG: NADP-dependent isocitrate dehydrogenase [Desulfovibrio sp.]|jgi:isocitrate dehydrogenase|nr:NADP-dependent isocitrate dehydrogenase [Desulfovibrio sp.]
MENRIEAGADGALLVPDEPVIPCMPGDGIGPEIWSAARPVLDKAVAAAYGGGRRIRWREIFAGEKALIACGSLLPEESLQAIRLYRVAIKGPLTTPVGEGFRSVNVTLRRLFDLYACIRPVVYLPPVPSPLKTPEKVDMVVFRENTEDVYMGIEWEAGSKEAAEVAALAKRLSGKEIGPDTGIGLKPISKQGTQRLVRAAIRYALEQGRDSVTLVHKGNIMKFTEGAFRNWGYEVAAREFAGQTLTEKEAREQYNGRIPAGKVLIRDRIADAMFQEIILRPERHSVLATPNLNGDYISDALAALVGGLGMAPGANIGNGYALFEATHGTAPDIAGQGKANPSSMILSGVMMLDHLGWGEAALLARSALGEVLRRRFVTRDLAGHMPGATEVSCAAFGDLICEEIGRMKEGA